MRPPSRWASLAGLVLLAACASSRRLPPVQGTDRTDEVAIYVPATATIDSVDDIEIIHVAPGDRIIFNGGECSNWTHDPLDAIASIVARVPFYYPFNGGTPLTDALRELDQIAGVIEKRSPAAWKKYELGKYLDDQNEKYRDRPSRLELDIHKINGRERERAVEFWKRAVAVHLSPDPGDYQTPFAFGPYYEANGRLREQATRDFPLQSAAVGAMIGVNMVRQSPGGRWKPTESRWRFGTKSESIWNNTGLQLNIALRMNDDTPGDNAPNGGCRVYYLQVTKP